MNDSDPAFLEFFAGEWQAMLDRVNSDASWDRKAAWLYWSKGETQMAVSLVEQAATFGIEVRPDGWYHNGSFIDQIDNFDGWSILGGLTPMTSTFCICNLVTGECTVTAPTPELIERAYHAAWAPKRGPEQVIAEFPAAFGVTIHNFNTFPSTMVYDGIALYARRKVAGNG